VLTLTPQAKEFVAEKGFDPLFGARPLHRAIQKYVEDPLAEFILNEQPEKGSHLLANMKEEGDGLLISVNEQTTSPSDKS
jgi:ATP-dependent Clp protease ATP-binding subunit ClpC